MSQWTTDEMAMHHTVTHRYAADPLPTSALPSRRRGKPRRRPRAAAAKLARVAAPHARRLPLLSAMVWTFLLVLSWQARGPEGVGVALYVVLVLLSAVAYLWPGAMHHALGRILGGAWDGDG